MIGPFWRRFTGIPPGAGCNHESGHSVVLGEDGVFGYGEGDGEEWFNLAIRSSRVVGRGERQCWEDANGAGGRREGMLVSDTVHLGYGTCLTRGWLRQGRTRRGDS